MIVVGRKKTWGWVLSMATQSLWAFYAVGTGQYGFLLGTCSYFAVYLNNWVLWRTGRSLADRVRVVLRRLSGRETAAETP